MKQWNIELGDVLRVTDESGEAVSLPTERSAKLLQVLAKTPGEFRVRTVVASELWPERNLKQRQQSLRQTIFLIRQAFGDSEILIGKSDGLLLNREKVKLIKGPSAVDSSIARGLLDAAEWHAKVDPETALSILASAPDLAIAGGMERCRNICDLLLERCSPSAAYARTLWIFAASFYGEQYQKSIDIQLRCLPMARRFGERSIWAKAAAGVVFGLFETGRTKQALAFADHFLATVDTSAKPHLEHAKAMALIHSNADSDGLALLEKIFSSSDEFASRPLAITCANNLGWSAAQLNQKDLCLKSLVCASGMAEESGATRALCVTDYVAAQALIADGRLSEARAKLRGFWRLVTDFQDKSAMAQAQEAAAEISVLEGDLERGAELIVRAHSHRAVRDRRYSPLEKARIRPVINRAKPFLTAQNQRRWRNEQLAFESNPSSACKCPF